MNLLPDRLVPALFFAVHLSMAALITEACGQDEQPKHGHTAEVNGITMYYETVGDGKPLVLLHGFGGSGQVWGDFIDEFSRHYKLIVPDLRGHGRSTNPTESFTHRQSALDIFALLNQLNIDGFNAAGISTGGMTLLHMATSQPERVNAVMLIGATHYFPTQARDIMRRVTEEQLTPDELAQRRKIHRHGDEQIRKLTRQFHNFKDSYDDMNFTGPFLSTIKAKTLIIHGDRDAFFPVDIPVEMYKSIPHSSLWIVPNGGHVPIYDDNVPFVETAIDFFRKADGQ